MRIKLSIVRCLVAVLLQGMFTFTQAQVAGCQAGKNALLLPPLYYNADNLRSDTFDILKYTINLEIGNATTKLIAGNTIVKFAPKMNNRTFIRLDLLKLIIDSVTENSNQLLYSYNDTILKVNFSAPKNLTDTSSIKVYYKGQPQGDASGWGGFYFDNNGGNQYAYNLGVGFAAKPHNYGRVWFPCFDNFVERSKYEFNITSDTARRAYCNGQLTSDVVNGLNRTRQWTMNNEIPTYLASVSVARYRQVNWSVNTLTGPKPIVLAGAATDTTGMKNGFVNLKTCINGFENYYGPYKWNRFGYCLVPFSSGAMEHATNISYPKIAIGNLLYEADLMAHELSHHWWGDNITCETPEDMWINEGMATYSQYMFTEWKYGKVNYNSAVKTSHDNLLHFLHLKEGGFRAISGIPHSLTYGDHVYKKGADVAHTLRGYMGDTAFFNAIKYTMLQNQYKSINSLQLRDLMQTASGQNLTDFFNNWVLAGGWPHFAIDSVKYVTVGTASVNAIVSLKQKTFGAPALYSNVPLEISFFKNDWSRVVRKVLMSGASATFTVNIPYSASYAALNYDSKISDATSSDSKVIKTATNINWILGKVYTQVTNKGADSSRVRIIHNYVKPDPFKSNPQNHRLSDQQYWDVEGILSPGFHSKITFYYDGNKSLGGTYSYLDTLLAKINGDSIRVFYRANAAADWQLVKHCVVVNSGLRNGFIVVDTMKLGQYTFGNSTDTATINSVKRNANVYRSAKLYPNPAKTSFKVEFEQLPAPGSVMTITDVSGKIVLSKAITEKLNSVEVGSFSKGTYLVKLEERGRILYSEKILVE
ncbi:MAG: T9SS type A sorting domain-containing protein [Bacteroidetes bacterium]|nr:T9SS type A sorting domain-containing protein [Bacteroidota bacterium]